MIATLTPEQTIAPYTPYDWQVKPWRDRSLTLLLTGSAGGGKSRLAAEKLHAYCLKYPGATAMMLRKTKESTTNSIVLFMERKIIGDTPAVRFIPSRSRFEYANGSILGWGGMKDDIQREQIRSVGQDAGLDIVWMEEAHLFTLGDYEEILARMRGKAGTWRQIIITTNPDSPRHWIYKRFIQGGEGSVYYSSALDNPANPSEYIDSLKKLTGIRGKRLRDGKWVQAEGAVYTDYDEELHLIEPFEVPADWKRYRVIDFGYTNPFTCQWWAEDDDGRLYMYREIYMSQRIVEDHAALINEYSEGERYVETICDHDAEDRATIERHCRCRTLGAIKDVSIGIQQVEGRLRTQKDGKPRLFLFRNALVETDLELELTRKPLCLADELPEYQWDKVRDGKALKEVPVKINDHGCDALRYMVMYLDDPNFVEEWIA